MNQYQQLSSKIKAWTRYVDFADNAKEQVSNIASLPFIYKHIAIMPDVHLGKGATVGSVIPTQAAIIPAAVGVDIGCGMMGVKTNLCSQDLPDSLKTLRFAIEQAIPLGFEFWHEQNLPTLSASAWQQLKRDFNLIMNAHPKIGWNKKAGKRSAKEILQLGTLGGGNHFIELCLDEDNQVWLMLHSGSRGIGNAIGTYFIELAKKDMGQLLGQIPDKDLAYFSEGSQHFKDYFFAVSWAQNYAQYNREIMMQLLISTVEKTLSKKIIPLEQAVNCHHNYVAKEVHFGKSIYVTRKGAISAKKDELGIIPGSMGAESFIVKGLGNKESFCSSSHGAGRIMSRHQAKKRIHLSEHEQLTTGVECRKDRSVLDESPGAYKNIQDVMRSQADLVEVIHRLKQVLCVKG